MRTLFVLPFAGVVLGEESVGLVQKTQRLHLEVDAAGNSEPEVTDVMASVGSFPIESPTDGEPAGSEPAPIEADPDQPCSVVEVYFESKEAAKSVKVGTTDECAKEGWGLNTQIHASCDSKDFPMTCKFLAEKFDVPEEVQELLQEPVPKPSLAQILAAVNHTHEMSKINFKYGIKGAKKGKRDQQYQWAAKAYAKALLTADGCKPATNGKPPARHMDCDACWWGFVPHPCNCNCRGWNQVATLCFQPCHENHHEYSHDSGAYCHKPCNREGQLALTEGCGHGHARNCVENAGACVSSILMKAWAFADVLIAIGTAGAGSAITSAARTAKTAGVKAAMAGMRAAVKTSAKNMAKKIKNKKWIKDQLAGQSESVRDNILENGATLMLTQSLPSDWGSAFLQVASIVDPTGVTGVVSEFMPKESCDEAAYFKDPLPGTDNSAPELAVLDECRVDDGSCSSSVPFSDVWSAQGGACTGSGGYTHCKFAQSHGWRRHEMATYSSGVTKAREFCLADAKAWGAVGASTALLWGWQYCFMFFTPGQPCPSSVTSQSGYYQEWQGRSGETLGFGGSTANYGYCMKSN